jgi:putative flippase GtrA
VTATTRRFLKFNGVGALGIAVQLVSVAALTAFGVPVVAATASAVLLTVLHNFFWHRHWTWRDRRVTSEPAALTFARFAMANGAVSLIGGAVVVWMLSSSLHTNAVIANAVAIAVCGLVNYTLGDRVVFVARR